MIYSQLQEQDTPSDGRSLFSEINKRSGEGSQYNAGKKQTPLFFYCATVDVVGSQENTLTSTINSIRCLLNTLDFKWI